MKKVNINTILTNGKALFLAYDQGLEHGPKDFNSKNVDPLYILDIAKKGRYNAIILQKGIAEKYNSEIKKSKVPLIIKLNGKTSLVSGEPVSRQICSVAYAIKLGAKAVGYTIYIGSKYESLMIQEFEKILDEAHKKLLPVILWAYPRGKGIENKTCEELASYAARFGLEIGADIVKIPYHVSKKDLKWVVKSAGKTKVMIAGGAKENEKDLLRQVKELIEADCIGLAIGRNIWQSRDPLSLTKKIKKIMWRKF